jgi:hypothetical protein
VSEVYPWLLAALCAGLALSWGVVARRRPPSHAQLMVARLNVLLALLWVVVGIIRIA